MNNLDKQYIELIKHILDTGYVSGDRTGTGTVKTFGNMISHNMKEGFPLLTIKRMFTKGIIYELLWFLRGETNIKFMVDNGVNIWVGDCYKKYKKYFDDIASLEYCHLNELSVTVDIDSETNDHSLMMAEPMSEAEFIQAIKDDLPIGNGQTFAQKWGELNKVYGAEWVNWDDRINQVQELIDTLKNNPDSRRMMVTAWNPTNVRKAVLPPCHFAYQVFTRELKFNERFNILKQYFKLDPNIVYDSNTIYGLFNSYNIPSREISLMFQMRSVDVGLGLPFDISSYGFLLSMIAQVVNMVPGELKMCLGDTHLYSDHIEPIKELFNRTPNTLPKLELNRDIDDIFAFKYEDIKIVDYVPNAKLDLPLSN